MTKKTIKKVREATRKAGGSTLTKSGRSSTLKRYFVDMHKRLNRQGNSFETLKVKDAQAWVNYLLRKGLKLRTIHNNMAHMRQALRTVNRGHFADSREMSNKALGISGGSRDGTHRALTDRQYRAVLAALRATNPGAASCAELQRHLGLRAREAIQSGPSLKTWLRALKSGFPGLIIHGTKGGRPRQLAVTDPASAIKAIETAIQVANAQGGSLIASPSLQSAVHAYMRACNKVGLIKQFSSHCFRCTYAFFRFAMYMALHGDLREALAALSLDLGHGDGRGTYVKQVYLKNPPIEGPVN